MQPSILPTFETRRDRHSSPTGVPDRAETNDNGLTATDNRYLPELSGDMQTGERANPTIRDAVPQKILVDKVFHS